MSCICVSICVITSVPVVILSPCTTAVPVSDPHQNNELEHISDELNWGIPKTFWMGEFARVIVEDGVVHLWGLVGSESERRALTALAQKYRACRTSPMK